ncbi:UNVERIFIED_CONTAM: hypothetical protein PYX00_005742 [Menopon gallinae]|uniref:Uncharacterized protein n=1 Tax=Menopon gallinae TaxID=328185 RepID=A0AAW2HTE2_9NEOP
MCSRAVLLLLLTIGFGRGGDVIINGGINRLRPIRKKEDYTFEGRLKRATEECSYIARNDDDSQREELIERIKNQMNVRRVVEFYEEREQDKKKSKEYYDHVEKEERRRVLESNTPPPPPPLQELPNFGRPNDFRRRPLPKGQFHKPPPPQPPVPRRPLPPLSFPEEPFSLEHEIFRRSPRLDPSFSEGTFKDHNNCFSRCVFARMELVDVLGFPQESYLRKALEDYIDNKKIRSSKIRRVYRCFDEVKKVAIDDNCIYSTKIFKCMRLDEAGSWS